MKNIFVKALFLTAFFVGFCGAAQAQIRQSVYLNGNIPVGQFAGKVDASHTTVPLTYKQIGKEAAVGFGAGYRVSYRFDVGVGMVSPFASVDLFWNMLGGKWRDKYENVDMSMPTYFNIPVMAGVSYLYDRMWSTLTPFAEFAVGADFMLITREGNAFKKNGNNDYYYAYKTGSDIAWMLGLGTYFGRHVSVGAYYYNLGRHTIDYTNRTLQYNDVAATEYSMDQVSGNFQRQRRTVGNFALRIGFHF